MTIYRGYGIAIIGIILGSALIANLLDNAFAGHTYWDTHGWPLAAALAFDSLVLFTSRANRRYGPPPARVAGCGGGCDNEARFARAAEQPRVEARVLWR